MSPVYMKRAHSLLNQYESDTNTIERGGVRIFHSMHVPLQDEHLRLVVTCEACNNKESQDLNDSTFLMHPSRKCSPYAGPPLQ